MSPSAPSSLATQPELSLGSFTREILKRTRPFMSDPTETRYIDSFGAELRKLGDKCRWMLAGTALEVWNKELFPLLEEVMESNKMEIYKDENIVDVIILRQCYMLGCDKEHAYPTLVVACNGKGFRRILRRTMKCILQVKDFVEQGFKVMGLRTPDLELKAGPEDCFAILMDPSEDNSLSGPISLCGRQILANNTQRKATIGGTIIVDDCYYAITAAHSFLTQISSDEERNNHTSKLEIFTSDWAQSDDDSEEDDSSLAELANAQNIHVIDSSGKHSSSRTPSDQLSADATVSTVGMDRKRILRVKHIDPDNDWALLHLEDPRYFGANEIHLLPQATWIYPQPFRKTPPHGDILIATQKRVTRGFGTGSACIMKLRGSCFDMPMWSVHTQETLPSGDCGVWVLDANTYEIFGSIVAGSDNLQESFLVPAENTRESIIRRLSASSIRLPTITDSLWLAVYFGNAATVEKLLNTNQADYNATLEVPLSDPTFNELKVQRMTMLHWSARQGYFRITQLLVEKGASVKARTTIQQTPLHLAATLILPENNPSDIGDKEKTLEFLLKQGGIEVRAQDKDGNSPLWWAQHTGFHIAQILIERKIGSQEIVSSQNLLSSGGVGQASSQMGPFGYSPFGASGSFHPGYGGPTLTLHQPASLASQVPLRNTKTARRNKAHVASACVNCKKAHLSCDVQRPCTRCVTSGKEATCYDVQHKKRARPRLRDVQEGRPAQGHELTEQSASASESPVASLASGSGRSEPFRSLRSTRRSFGASASIRQPTSQLHSLSSSPFPPEGALQYPGPEYSRLAPSLVTPMALLNLDLHIIKTNTAFNSLFGRTDLPGRELTDLVESHHIETLQRLWGELREERDAREPSYMPPIFGLRERETVQNIEEEDLDRISHGYTDRAFTWWFSSIFGQPQEVRVRVLPLRSEQQQQLYPPAFATTVARQRSSRPPSRAAPTPMSEYSYPYGQNSPPAVSELPSLYTPYFSLQSLTSSLPPAVALPTAPSYSYGQTSPPGFGYPRGSWSSTGGAEQQLPSYEGTLRRPSSPVMLAEGSPWRSESRTWQPQQYPPTPKVSSDHRRSRGTSEGTDEEKTSKRRRLNIRDLV